MAEIKRLRELQAKLQKLIAQQDRRSKAVVFTGFTAAYAIWVHEMRRLTLDLYKRTGRHADGSKRKGYYWDPQGKAGPKFLENPARELSNNGVLVDIIIKAMRAGKTMASALILAGLRLQREAQLRVPVDSGNLKASAFTRLAQGEEGEVS